MSQVTISPPVPRGGQKIHGLNDTGTKKMWVEKFKSPIVTRTNRVGWIGPRKKRGWTKRQGTSLKYRQFLIPVYSFKKSEDNTL